MPPRSLVPHSPQKEAIARELGLKEAISRYFASGVPAREHSDGFGR
jgi:hypothetical protein